MKKCVILVGPSGVGKTTIAHEMLEMGDKYELVRSVTTRELRGDTFGSEYIYISNEEFLHQIEVGGVLEHTEYAGHLYGTPRSEIDRITSEGRVPLLILDLNGAESLYKAEGLAPCTVYLYDNLDVMQERLRQRYISDNTSEADQRRYDSRTKQNLVDYANIVNNEPYIYSFVKNCSTVCCCAKLIDELYDAFALDAPKNAEEAKSICDALVSEAKAKL